MEKLGKKQKLADERNDGAASVNRFVGLRNNLQKEMRNSACYAA